MENSNNDDKWLCQLMWAIGFVLFVMMLSAFVVIKLILIGDWEQRGPFGDLVGVVNALFSGLAFAGLIITIRQQHLDLKYQREAIEQTNQEMQNQTIEYDKQNKTMRIERFENTFFKMLEVQQSIVNDLYAGDSHSQWVDENDDTRYHLSAFFSKGELDKGHALLNRWRTFIKDKKASVKLIRRSHSAHYF